MWLPAPAAVSCKGIDSLPDRLSGQNVPDVIADEVFIGIHVADGMKKPWISLTAHEWDRHGH